MQLVSFALAFVLLFGLCWCQHVQPCTESQNYFITTTTGSLGCDSYEGDIVTQWLIELDDNTKKVHLVFTSFETEAEYDTVSIYNGNSVNSRLIGSYSGSLVPGPFVSSANSLLIIFESDDNTEGAGFSAEWNTFGASSPCFNSMVTQLTGAEGNFGCDGYADSLYSSWHIIGDIGERLVLTFDTFSTQPNADFIRVYDGSSDNANLIAEASGYDLPPPVTASSNELYVRFVSDAQTTDSGFHASWEGLVEYSDPCFNSTNLVLVLPEGYLGCPYGYGNNVETSWLIYIRGDFKVHLDFFSISTEEGRDTISLYDGNSTDASLVGVYSGTERPPPFLSSTNSVLLVLNTDSQDTGNGFTATYHQLQVVSEVGCTESGVFTMAEPEGTIGCDGYSSGIRLEWNIESDDPNQVISLSFESFSCEGDLDYLYIFEGNHLLATYTGRDSIPEDVISSSSSLTVRFITQTDSLADDGFFAYYQMIARVEEPVDCMTSHDFELTDFSGDLGCPGYGNNVNVTWAINIEPSFIVKLDFTSFGTQSIFDVVTIYNGNSAAAEVLGSFAGRSTPPTQLSTSNSMFITFVTNESVAKTGFTASYTSIFSGTDTVQCDSSVGLALADLSGSIGCDGYAPNIDSYWMMTAVEGGIVELNFVSFDTEEEYDVVTVRDGSNSNAPLLGSFSGNIIPPPLRSSGNKMHVSFSSDSSTELSGFEAHYNSIANNNTDVIPRCTQSEHYELSEPRGQFGCDGYGNGVDSTWIISLQPGQQITLTVIRFDTEELYDYVKVYDGELARSPLLITISGHHTPPPITSTGSSLFITFHSDSSGTYGGFIFEYEAFVKEDNSCSVDDSHVLTDPFGSFGCDGYADNVEVSWLIQTPGYILLQFERFETESNEDLLTVYNGSDANAEVLAVFSGNSAHAVSSTEGAMYIVFTSDSSVTLHGFQCNYASISIVY